MLQSLRARRAGQALHKWSTGRVMVLSLRNLIRSENRKVPVPRQLPRVIYKTKPKAPPDSPVSRDTRVTYECF